MPDFTATPGGLPVFPLFPGSSASRPGPVSRLFAGDSVPMGGGGAGGASAVRPPVGVHVDDSFTDGTSGDHTPSSAFVTPESFAAGVHVDGNRSFGEISGIDLSALSGDVSGDVSRGAGRGAGAGAVATPASAAADASMDLETSATFSP